MKSSDRHPNPNQLFQDPAPSGLHSPELSDGSTLQHLHDDLAILLRHPGPGLSV